MKTKNKSLGIIAGIFLFVGLLSMVSAVSLPEEPEITEKPSVPVVPALSVTGKTNITVNNPVQHNWNIQASSYPDRDVSDLDYSWFFGLFVIMDNSGNVIYEKDPVDLGSSNTYQDSVKYTFEEPGTYYYVPAIVEVKKQYKDEQWEKVSEKIIKKDVKKIKVMGEPGVPVLGKIGDFFNRLWQWVTSLF